MSLQNLIIIILIIFIDGLLSNLITRLAIPLYFSMVSTEVKINYIGMRPFLGLKFLEIEKILNTLYQ